MKDLQFPDYMKYSDKYSAEGLVEMNCHIPRRAGAKLVYAALILYYTLQSKNVPLKDKAIIIGALGYLISPLDVIPDAIPIAGLGDDVAVLLYVLHKIKGDLTDEVKQRAYDKLSKWFDEDEIEEANHLWDDTDQ